jgi:hypothetical protein
VIEPIALYKLKRRDTTWWWVNFSMNFADILASCMRLCAAARLGKEAERRCDLRRYKNEGRGGGGWTRNQLLGKSRVLRGT